MVISLLVEDEDEKACLEKLDLPAGVTARLDTYHADGGDLFIFSFGTENDTLDDARTVSGIWDILPNVNVYVLEDDASSLFGEKLYPLLSRFERSLRSALIIRVCANHENAKSITIEDIERKSTLGSLANNLLVDEHFVSKVKSIVNKRQPFNREELKRVLDDVEEQLLWDRLFDTDAMPTVRARFKEIEAVRNDVMHSHRMTFKEYDVACELLNTANREIDDYIHAAITDRQMMESNASNSDAASDFLNDVRVSNFTELKRQLQEQWQLVYEGNQLAEWRETCSALEEALQYSAAQPRPYSEYAEVFEKVLHEQSAFESLAQGIAKDIEAKRKALLEAQDATSISTAREQFEKAISEQRRLTADSGMTA